MTRLVLAGALVGVLATLTLAWELRESVAYAEEAQEGPSLPVLEAIDTDHARCLGSGGTWLHSQSGELCLENLGVVRMPKGGVR